MEQFTQKSGASCLVLVLCCIAIVHSTCPVTENCDICGKPEMYGTDCTVPCPQNCDSGCDRDDGHCDIQCKLGFMGPYCNQTCPVDCKLGCNQTTGYCFESCEIGRYGDRCTEECSCGGSVCNRHSGDCVGGSQSTMKPNNGYGILNFVALTMFYIWMRFGS